MSVSTLLLAALLGAEAATTAKGPICTDRPAKANATCTVPVGGWQLESSAASWSRTADQGSISRTFAIGSTVIKRGLSDRSDLQIGYSPYVRTTTSAGGAHDRVSGPGDLTIRFKHRLTTGEGAIQAALIPFVKLPTADRDIGNGKVEGGLSVPVGVGNVGPVAILFGPEVDVLANADGNGHHFALVNLVNGSAPIAQGVTLYGELLTMTHFDPAGTITLASADSAVAWLVSDALQLDIGANMGLTRHTPDVEAYAGISIRF